MRTSSLKLRDGSRIAILGGGPAGSLFAHFALLLARRAGIGLDITIFDGKSFSKSGARGCNMCAGVIAKSYADFLRATGIELPPNVVQRTIEGYWLETPVGSVYLHHELQPGGILTVYRGNGPRGSSYQGNISFDDYLLDGVRAQGVRVIPYYASDVHLPTGLDAPAQVLYGQGKEVESLPADLVVGAFGLNSKMAQHMAEKGFGYRPPDSIKAFQAEIPLDPDHIQASFGNSIYVYALRTPGVKFSAITPKHEYLTATLVGPNVGEGDIVSLLNNPVVRRRLPPDWELPRTHCRCQPRVAASASRQPYADRLVIIGDASDSRLYKNGLESSLITARAAAEAALGFGISAESFRDHYYPVCRAISRDSYYGKTIFWAQELIFANNFSMRMLLNAARMEQQRYEAREQLINELLWNLLTGNRPYKDIFLMSANPQVHFRTLKKTARSLWHRIGGEQPRG
ncbi:MAG: hypothetical protein M1358_19290 [Chloroflexi bacterium]|nr:hypothetical protein [Chloroflexota bacterium]